jgi:hypothetical protein
VSEGAELMLQCCRKTGGFPDKPQILVYPLSNQSWLFTLKFVRRLNPVSLALHDAVPRIETPRLRYAGPTHMHPEPIGLGRGILEACQVSLLLDRPGVSMQGFPQDF